MQFLIIYHYPKRRLPILTLAPIFSMPIGGYHFEEPLSVVLILQTFICLVRISARCLIA